MPADREQSDLDSAGLAPTPQLAREHLADPLADPLRDPLSEQPRVRLEGDLAGEERRTTLPPPRERDDELMDNPPVGDYHRGRLGGHQSGRRMRIIFGILAVALVAGGVGLMVWYVRNRPPQHSSQFELPPGSDLEGRPRVMTWTGGKARLGLDRKPPGVLEISLPDRTLRLADGSDQAQMKVEVEDGKTVALKVIFGEVVEELAPGANPLLAR
ncbi:MAG TPA: hypothetical protein VGB85_18300 [Nannocystis sp.]|jgi:hypothetical protein